MSIGEAARVVTVEVRGVVFFFEDGLPKENERPGDVKAVGRPPFVPNVEEGIPSMLSRGAFHEIVLGGLQESLVAALAGGRNSHDLEPSTYQQPIVKDQPGKRPHLAWVGVVPHSGDDLGDCRVAEVQMLDESDDAGSVLLPPCISVSPLSRVAKEGGVAHVARLLPVPVSGVPWKIENEAGLKDPVDWRSFSWGRNVLGQSERCSMALLNEHFDRLVPFKRDDDVM